MGGDWFVASLLAMTVIRLLARSVKAIYGDTIRESVEEESKSSDQYETENAGRNRVGNEFQE